MAAVCDECGFSINTERDGKLVCLACENDRLREALKPFAFLSEATTQAAWEMRYRDRFQDWVDFNDIDHARNILSKNSAE